MFIYRFRRGHSDSFEALSASGVNHLKPRKTVFHQIHDWCGSKLTPVLVVMVLAVSGSLSAQTPVDAQDDLTLFGSEDFSFSLPVLANDLGDLDSSTLTVQTTPLLGTAVPNPATGSLDYTPFPDVWGTESFRYSIMDTMGNIDSALVSFTIFGSNDPPIVNPDADSVLNSSTIVLEPLLNDNDTIDILSSIVPSTINIITPPANGFATENLASGTITYNPFLGFSGLDSLQYEVCDNGLPLPSQCGTAWIYITVIDSIEVNDDVEICEGDSVQLLVTGVGPFTWSPAAGLSCTDCTDPWATPTATTTYTVFSDAGGCCPHSVDVTVTVNLADTAIAGGDSASVSEEGTVIFDLLANDFFLDSASVALISGPSFGSVSITDGVATYTPDPEAFGLDSFYYLVCSEGCPTPCDTGLAKILVEPVNDPPIALDDILVIDEDTPGSAPVLANDSDVDGNLDTATLIILIPPTNGVAVVDVATGSITYTPDPDYFGPDQLTYVICDDGTPLPSECDTAILTITVNPVNDAPIAVNDSLTILEDNVGTVDLDLNDTDVEGPLDPATIVVISGPANGGLSIDPLTGVATYTPDPDYFGLDSFQYEICDAGLPVICDTAWVIITVEPVNDPPVANNDILVTTEDTPGSVVVVDNDFDIDGNLDTAGIIIVIPPLNGVAVVDPLTGTITYTPDPDYNGPDLLAYLICDDGTPLPSECDTGVVFISVSPVNDPPVAVTETVTILEDSFAVIDVAANDTDVEGLDLTSVSVIGGPFNGSVAVDPVTGEVTYTPDPDYYGVDSFLYEICDNGPVVICDTAIVYINVDPVNDPPIAVDDAGTTPDDTPVIIDVVANDTDIDGSPVPGTVTIISGPTTGSVSVNPVTGEVTYTPLFGFIGTDVFTYEICDDGFPLPSECDTATVVITITLSVNDPPLAVNDSLELFEDSVGVIDVLANDVDPEGAIDPASVVIIAGPFNGSTVVDTVTGEVTYTPDPNYYGADSFLYRVCDLGTPTACGQAWVILNVLPVNDAPVLVNDSVSTDEDLAISVDVLANDSDIDGSLITFTVTPVTAPSNGTISGVDPFTGIITYNPAPGFSGVDSFSYLVCDDGFPAPGICEEAWVFITVIPLPPPNTAPVASTDSFAVWEDSVATLDVLANDTDAVGSIDPTAVTILTGAANGSLSVDPVSGEVTYTPDLNYFGADSFQYEVCDDGIPSLCGGGWVILDVLPINDAPLVLNDTVSTTEDIPVVIDVLSNDSDVDGSLVTFTVTPVTAPSDGSLSVDPLTGQITYTPDPGFVGVDSFTYLVCDDGFPTPSICEEAMVIITVIPDVVINVGPVAVNDSMLWLEDSTGVIDVIANDSDPVGSIDPATVSILTGAPNGTLSVDPVTGEVTYTPDLNYFGMDSFQYEVCDDGTPVLCASAWVIIDVQPVNDAPVVVDDSVTTTEDIPVVIDVLSNDSDVDGSLVTFTVTPVSAPSDGSLTVDPLTGAITYTPDPGFVGVDSFTYLVCDDGFPTPSICEEATVYILVIPDVIVNLPPVALDDAFDWLEDSTGLIDVLDNDLDIDGAIDATAVSILTPAPNGSTSVDPVTGEITYTPDLNYFGLDSFQYEVCDDGAPVLCSSAWVVLNVQPVNDAPVAIDDAAATPVDVAVIVDVLVNDTDVDGTPDPATVTVLTAPANGTAVPDAITGEVIYTPDAGYTGVDSFGYIVCDDGFPLPSECDSAWVFINVTPVAPPNVAPIAANDSMVVWEDSFAIVDVLVNDVDPDGILDEASLLILTVPEHGTAVVDPATGEITYTPEPDYYGLDSFFYNICDTATPPLCATAWVIVDVQPINDAPIAADDFVSGESETAIPVDVLDNDTDVDGSPDPGTVSVITDPENGTASVDPLTGFVTYTSDAGFVGADSLQYVVCDDGFPLPSECDTAWLFMIVLTPVDTNADIIAVNDTITVIEDIAQTVEVLLNDFDPENNIDTGSLIILTPALNGSTVVDLVDGTVIYTPDTDFFGADSFRYQISDADVPVSSDDAWVLFKITPVEDPPIAVNDTGDIALGESVSMDVLANDFDPEGDLDTSSLTLITPPLNGSLDQVDNNYLYTPDEGWCGTDSFQYSICDGGGLCDDAWVIIYVGCDSTSDFYATDDVVSIEYGDAVFVPVLANDDPRADASCLMLVTEPVSGTAEVQPDGTIRYIPDPGFYGIDCFRYSVCDSTGTMSDDARVCVEVAFQEMVISTGISPNNDGANDFFTILGIDRHDDHEVSIYNRWGNLVFRSDNYNNDWDGTRNGKPLPAGTYFYVIRLDVKEPGGAILKGSLTLRR